MRITEYPHAWYLMELIRAILEQLMLIIRDIIHTNSLDIIECRSQSYSTDEVGSASLEFIRQFIEGCTLERHRLDHLATTLVGHHLFEPFALAIKHTYSRRAINLMTREDKEVAIQILDIHLDMRYRLCTIDEDRHALLVSEFDDFLDRIDRSQHI